VHVTPITEDVSCTTVDKLSGSLRREFWAWRFYDFSRRPVPAVANSFLYVTLKAMFDVANVVKIDPVKKLPLGAFQVGPISLNGLSFVTCTQALAALIQIVLFLTLGPCADFGNLRRPLLLFFSLLGGASGAIWLAFNSVKLWWLGGIVSIIFFTSYGLAVVFYNSYLPLLINDHPSVIASTGLAQRKIVQKESATLSSTAFMLGYLGSAAILICALRIFDDNARTILYGYRIIISFCGIWWFVFCLPAIFGLNARPRSPLPANESYLTIGWKTAFKTAKKIWRMPNVARYLLAYFLFIDGIGTIASVAALFAVDDLNFTGYKLTLLVLEIPSVAFFATAFWAWFSRVANIPPKNMLLVHCCSYILLGVYVLCGQDPANTWALRTESAMYVAGAWHGLHVGSIQAFGRSVFAEMVPAGYEADFFSFFQLTDEGSSFLGPLMATIITGSSGSTRLVFVWIILVFLLAIPTLWFVDVNKAAEESMEMEEKTHVQKMENNGKVNILYHTSLSKTTVIPNLVSTLNVPGSIAESKNNP